MATQFSMLAWRMPWSEEPSGLQPIGLQKVGQDRMTDTHTHAHNWVNGKTTCGVSMQWNTTQQQQQILIDITT